MSLRIILKGAPALLPLAMPQVVFAGDVINDGTVVAGSPNVTSQVAIDDGKILEVQSGASIENGAAHAVIDAVDGTTVTIINDGSISTTDDLYDAISTQNSTLELTNTGTISGLDDAVDTGDATVISNSGTIFGGDDGIYARGHIETLTNSGTISAESGSIIRGGSIGTISNSGELISEEGDGILAIGTIDTLINSGSIVADDEAVDSNGLGYFRNTGSVTGGDNAVFVDGDVQTFINEGTLTGEDEEGVRVGSFETFSNTGRITGNDDAILIDNGLGAGTADSFHNAGEIIGGDDGIEAVSITSLTNTGRISGENNAISLDHGTVINSGTLTGTNGAAVSFDQDTTGKASLTNSGLIQNANGPDGAAIDFQSGGTGHLTLEAGSVIIGTINLGTTSDTLTVGDDLSIAYTFIGMPEVVEANDAIVAMSGNQVAVIDTTGLFSEGRALVDLTGSISGVIADRLWEETDFHTLPAGVVVATHGHPEKRRGIWLSGFGGASSWKDSGSGGDSDHAYGGFVSGIDGMLASGTRLGVFAGASAGRVDADHGDNDVSNGSYYGGLYGLHEVGRYALGFTVTGGYSDYDSERDVQSNTTSSGTETATASYGGWFIAPEASAAAEFSVLNRAIRPSATVRYVGAWLDGYTESGSSANLTVDDRSLHELVGRVQLAVPAYQGTQLTLETRLGVDGRLSLGDDTLTGVLLGQDFSFASGNGDEAIGAFAGVNMNGKLSGNSIWFASAEAGIGSDTNSRGEGRVGMRIRF
ncbi:autotransporter domain-containing protein [Roseibium sp. SCP14]|uniref:autotransporter family protein n=1 Tax=Roseibium sp. SCP14 TaxID=3141375 RepID=UPI003335DA6E